MYGREYKNLVEMQISPFKVTEIVIHNVEQY